MNKKLTYIIVSIISVILLTFMDQITKYLAIVRLSPQNKGSDFILVEGVFRLRYLENCGSAFGLMQGQKIFLITITIIVLLLLCWVFYRLPAGIHFSALRWLITIVMAGAIGNFIDRVRLGYVIDFFYFELIDFPIFNVADIYVTCSVIGFLILSLFFYKEEDFDCIFPTRKKKGEKVRDSVLPKKSEE